MKLLFECPYKTDGRGHLVWGCSFLCETIFDYLFLILLPVILYMYNANSTHGLPFTLWVPTGQ